MRTTKIELQQHNTRLAEENTLLRMELSALRTQLEAQRVASSDVRYDIHEALECVIGEKDDCTVTEADMLRLIIASNTALRTQSRAANVGEHRTTLAERMTARRVAVLRLAKQYPQRKSFTEAEILGAMD